MKTLRFDVTYIRSFFVRVPDDVEPDDVQDFEQVTEQIDNVKGDGMHRDSYNFMEDEDIMDDCTIITLDPDKD